MASICGESYLIFHLSVFLSLKLRFSMKILHFHSPPQKILLGKKVCLGKWGEKREVEGGWGGNVNDSLLIFTRCSLGFTGFVQGPPCGVLKGSGRVQSGIWPQLFRSCYHHWPQCTTSKLKQILKKRERRLRVYAATLNQLKPGGKVWCWHDIKVHVGEIYLVK